MSADASAPAELPPPFSPSSLLRNTHVQSILASISPRRRQWRRRDDRMEQTTQRHVLDCGDDVRLLGFHSPHPQSRGLVVMIHGWEGCQDSVYLYAMACTLYAAGYSVFRLNLRDHGDTHALNELPFHSARMAEVLGAFRAIQQLETTQPLICIGFSLGGNFALRVGLMGPPVDIKPDLSIGISPVINPETTLEAIDAGSAIYRRYFLNRWRQTLKKKSDAWPGRFDFSDLDTQNRFVDVTKRFVQQHTEYPSYEAYLGAYTLTPDMLMNAPSPLAIITAQDDPVIPYVDFEGLRIEGSLLGFEAPQHGGHCGFIENWAMDGWADRCVLRMLNALPRTDPGV